LEFQALLISLWHFEFCGGLDTPTHFEFCWGLDTPTHFEFCGGLDTSTHFEFGILQPILSFTGNCILRLSLAGIAPSQIDSSLTDSSPVLFQAVLILL
jgi:hypothetical protein